MWNGIRAALVAGALLTALAGQTCESTVVAQVAAIDQPFMFNRLGSAMPQGMIFALLRDVVDNKSKQSCANAKCSAGHVMLRPDKRPRPLVLRVNKGQCLQVEFTNLLDPEPTNVLQPATRNAGIHLTGLNVLDIKDDSSWVGANENSLTVPGGHRTYKYFAREQGTFLLYSAAGDWAGQVQAGLFGAVNVEPQSAEWYRSQVTHEDMVLASYRAPTVKSGEEAPLPANPNSRLKQLANTYQLTTVEPDRQTVHSTPVNVVNGHIFALDGRPLIDYNAVYPPGNPRAGTPILNMLQKRADATSELIYSDLTAVITGPNADRFPYNEVGPDFNQNPALPDRRQPFREITVVYHEAFAATQPFEAFYDPAYNGVIGVNGSGAGADQFAINYGAAGITAEVLANRLGVGPAGGKDSVDLKFEEFFLSSWANGDPAVLVDVPANAPNQIMSDPAHGSQNSQQPLPWGQALCGKDSNAQTELNNGAIPACLKQAFAQNNLPLSSTAQVSTVPPPGSGQWIITDPNTFNPPAPSRNRYPIQANGTQLQAFQGFPVNADWQSFNSQNKVSATKAFYPDDPSNVWHSYMRDHVLIRLLHGGGGITHVHHMHAHQWLHSPNSDNSAYLDSQMINPGSTYTLDMVYNGSGNRNQTVGDSIFHCHFYPHFAGGMWGLWRIHDVFEAGTVLRDGKPAPGWNRTLPDAEISAGTPIPAIVPLPTLGMAPAPARVRLIDNGRRIEVEPKTTAGGEPVYENPGYPFFIPGVSGHRAPHPPLDFAWEEDKPGVPKMAAGDKIYLDGGLPRHLILDGKTVREIHTRWDFSKDFVAYNAAGKPIAGGLTAFQLPELGTAVEKAAMRAHSIRTHPTLQPNGDPGNFTLNGLPATNGAPYANPSVDDFGNAQINTRRYQGAAIQVDAVFNKQGWHFPQQRVVTLWEDVKPTVSGLRALQPFFFRVNTGETIEFWHTNLVPDYYELDDFQVRTPTDIIGQHIHLVKFDVTSSDGAANGFNYEDGTLSPDEVRKRIDAVNLSGGLYNFNQATQFKGAIQRRLTAKPAPAVFGTPPAGQNWTGAQTTIQKWDTDPLLNNRGVDRTMRTVFTHDHFGPSTHQQVGLYGGLLIEPEGAKWYDSVTGEVLYDTSRRADGGPTTWAANIVTPHQEDSFREFALEFGDFQLAYSNQSPSPDSKTGLPPPPPPAAVNAVSNICPPPVGTEEACGVSNLIADLNKGGRVSTAIVNAFAGFGVTLNRAATVAVQSDTSWMVSNPMNAAGPADCKSPLQSCDFYQVTGSVSAATGLKFFPLSMSQGWTATAFALNPTGFDPDNSQNGAPYPTLISVVQPPGVFGLNYRSEPVPSRIWQNPPTSGLVNPPNSGDLSYAFTSILRADPQLNIQPSKDTKINPSDPSPNAFKFPANIGPTINGPRPGCSEAAEISKIQPCDPFTPMLRAYANDRVQVRTLVGSQHNPHYFDIHGVKWLFEPSDPNSGYHDNQTMGISEHFEMLFRLPHAANAPGFPFSDYLYEASASTFGLTNGLWGIMRAYTAPMPDLKPLPNNPQPSAATTEFQPPTGVEPRRYHVVATTAAQALPGGTLVYNSRGQLTGNNPATFQSGTQIEDPYALIYVHAEDLTSPDKNGTLLPGKPIEPLVLRAAAGEWIQITLTNAVDPSRPTFSITAPAQAPFAQPNQPIPPPLPQIDLVTSPEAGLHAQRVAYDTTKGSGENVGFNPAVTVKSGESKTFYWYAGTVRANRGGLETLPVELGAVSLLPSDPLMQHPKGLVGALIVEPRGATWQTDVNSRASATVSRPNAPNFREFVVLTGDDITLYSGKDAKGNPLPYANSSGPISTSSLNYGIEPMPYRFTAVGIGGDVSQGTSDSQVQAEPQTPVFVAGAGSQVRFRMLHPAGISNTLGNLDGNVYTVDGHLWQEEPYIHESQEIGFNPQSQWFGTRGNHGPRDGFEIVIDSAGGPNKAPGDYIYRSLVVALGGGDMSQGLWGIFRVTERGKDAVVVTQVQTQGQGLTANGVVSVTPDSGAYAKSVQLFAGPACSGSPIGSTSTNNGAWTITGTMASPPASVCALSSNGGMRVFEIQPARLTPAAPPATTLRRVPTPAIVDRLSGKKPGKTQQ